MIIGITGLIGSGKSTVASILATEHNFKQMAFADSLKDCVSVIFSWDRSLLEGRTPESREWRDQIDEWWASRLGIPNLTPRWVLQYWGTDILRKHFHDDIWIASLMRHLGDTSDNIVITDCRFSNEVAAIKNAGGVAIRVQRGPNPDWYDSAISYNRGPNGNSSWAISKRELDRLRIHASEYSSIGLNYNYLVENNGTIDELHNKMYEIINNQSEGHPVAK